MEVHGCGNIYRDKSFSDCSNYFQCLDGEDLYENASTPLKIHKENQKFKIAVFFSALRRSSSWSSWVSWDSGIPVSPITRGENPDTFEPQLPTNNYLEEKNQRFSEVFFKKMNPNNVSSKHPCRYFGDISWHIKPLVSGFVPLRWFEVDGVVSGGRPPSRQSIPKKHLPKTQHLATVSSPQVRYPNPKYPKWILKIIYS